MTPVAYVTRTPRDIIIRTETERGKQKLQYTLLSYFLDTTALKRKAACKIKRTPGNIPKDRIESLRTNYARTEQKIQNVRLD